MSARALLRSRHSCQCGQALIIIKLWLSLSQPPINNGSQPKINYQHINNGHWIYGFVSLVLHHFLFSFSGSLFILLSVGMCVRCHKIGWTMILMCIPRCASMNILKNNYQMQMNTEMSLTRNERTHSSTHSISRSLIHSPTHSLTHTQKEKNRKSEREWEREIDTNTFAFDYYWQSFGIFCADTEWRENSSIIISSNTVINLMNASTVILWCVWYHYVIVFSLCNLGHGPRESPKPFMHVCLWICNLKLQMCVL